MALSIKGAYDCLFRRSGSTVDVDGRKCGMMLPSESDIRVECQLQ